MRYAKVGVPTIVIEHELEVKDSVVARMVLGVRNRLVAQLAHKSQSRLQEIWNVPKVILKLVVKSLRQRQSRRDMQVVLEKSFAKGGFKL